MKKLLLLPYLALFVLLFSGYLPQEMQGLSFAPKNCLYLAKHAVFGSPLSPFEHLKRSELLRSQPSLVSERPQRAEKPSCFVATGHKVHVALFVEKILALPQHRLSLVPSSQLSWWLPSKGAAPPA